MRRSLARAAAGSFGAAIAVALSTLVAGPALADEPFRLSEEITDRVGALGDRTDEVQDAIDQLYEDHRLQLWVVYVDDFSDYGGVEWADLTAVDSELTINDALLAVATDGRAYGLSVDPEYDITDEQLDEIIAIAVEPALRENDWAGAAIGAANGFSAVRSGQEVVAPEITPGDADPSPGGSAVPWVVGGVAVAGLGAAGVYAVNRRRGSRGGGSASGELSTDELSTEELRSRASALLVETDDAITTSAQEVGFAQAQFGAEAAQPFADAVANAREHAAASFAIKQRLDDDEPEDEPTERAMLGEIIQRLESAQDELDGQADAFARLRDLERHAPEVLSRVKTEADDVAGRIERARAAVADMTQRYTEDAVQPVAENPEQAQARLDFARTAAAEADQKIAAGSTSEAAVAVQAAELAVGQAATLLEAVDRRHGELRTAESEVGASLAEVESDLVEAAALTEDGARQGGVDTATLQSRVTAAENVVATVHQGVQAGRFDPLAALSHLQQVGQQLDEALAGARDAAQRAERARAALDHTVLSARGQIAATNDFITTRRGAIGGEARTRLVEAQRRLDQAVALATTDPAAALQHAQQATSLAQEADQLARRDVGGFAGPGESDPFGGAFGRQSGGGLNSAILGGILGGMLSGGSRSGGGFGGGGYSGGFGGRSSGRGSSTRSSSGSRSRSSRGRSPSRSRRSRGGRF